MTDDVRGEGIAYNKTDFFFLVGSTGLQAATLSLFCDFMWMKEHAELLCAFIILVKWRKHIRTSHVWKEAAQGD